MKYLSQGPIGVFQYSRDIGSPKLAGSASYDETTQTYTIKGAGYNIWGQRDEHHYCYNKLTGDFILTANFKFKGVNKVHRKIGWMVRASEADNSVMCGGFIHGDGLTAMQWRERRGADMENPYDDTWAAKRYYEIIQVERHGKEFIMRAAHPGEPLQFIAFKVLDFIPDEVLAGVVIGSRTFLRTENGYSLFPLNRISN